MGGEDPVRLSASLTPLFRIGVPLVLTAIGICIGSGLVDLASAHSLNYSLLGLVPGMAGVIFVDIMSLRLKTLKFYQGTFHARGILRTISFKPAQIRRIRFFTGAMISFIRLTVENPNGAKPRNIWLIPPPYLLGWKGGVHPTVRVINEIRESAVMNRE